MARKFPDGLNDAIWALMGAELSAGKIRSKLVEGDAGLPKPCSPSVRTIQLRMAKLREERGPLQTNPGDVADTAEAVSHEILRAARRQVALLPKGRIAKPVELQSLERLTRIVNELRKGSHKDPAKQHAGNVRQRGTKPDSMLTDLVEAERKARSRSKDVAEEHEAIERREAKRRDEARDDGSKVFVPREDVVSAAS
jgi:hypothetical protein